MNLGELFDNLSFGAVGNLSIGNNHSGELAEASKPRMAYLAKSALDILYSRFILARGYQSFLLSADVHAYALTADDPSLVGSYEGLAIKILDATFFDAEGEPLDIILNTRNNPASPKVVGMNKLWIESPCADATMTLEYQCRHPVLTGDEAQEIELPPVLEPALEALVAARVYAGMNGEENIAKASGLRAEANSLMGLVDQNDLLSLSSSSETPNQFKLQGFK